MQIPEEIIHIQQKKISDIWKNNLVGFFIYNDAKLTYHFIETTFDAKFLKEPETVQLKKNPVCSGFMAYLISNMGKKTTHDIFDSYLSQAYNKYLIKNQYEPSFNPTIALNNFYEIYFQQENISMLNSSKIYSFIPHESEKLINNYIEAYENYIKQKIINIIPESLRSKFTGFKEILKYRLNVGEDMNVIKKQFYLLHKEGFINCEENSFLFRLGYDVENITLDKIKWTSKNKKSNNPNKLSLLDYLNIIGISEKDIKDKVNQIFEIPNGVPFAPNNYKYINGTLNTISEYHDQLVEIVNISKEK
jgi:hypothetical protein